MCQWEAQHNSLGLWRFASACIVDDPCCSTAYLGSEPEKARWYEAFMQIGCGTATHNSMEMPWSLNRLMLTGLAQPAYRVILFNCHIGMCA